MEKARIGIIGVGWWGTVSHLEPLADDPRTELVAVWSRTESKAQARAERYGVPRHYTDYRRMIDECPLDGVIVASTPNVHYEHARYALEHGLHVLMEKPFVLRAEHAVELERLAQEKGLLLSVCHPMLHCPALAEARDEVRGGALGRILLVTALFSQRVYDLYQGRVSEYWHMGPLGEDALRPNAASYSDPAVVGGGEGHTQASHIVGMLLWLTGLRPVAVFAHMNYLDLPVDVVNAMTVRFAGGALATVAANGLLPPRVSSTQIQIQGDGGIFSLDTVSRSAVILTAEDPKRRELDLESNLGYAARGAVPRKFVRAILGEEPLYVETTVAIDEVRILAAAYQSAATGREIEL